ncbi:octopamine receptor 1-like [Mizuhopecten yessoensis]|uniref:Octopamine receptor 1 n=1 Tax=Mizuhopecten yessoensis TaxID=6573 RepID=A0A210QLA7_MIZYE|nr:octopamine receptor 1-like [Mizuhopecten yessoensis]XP_021355584.1 octopamine receptor 1-like [Mizuhopecten yessoensis]OWF49506.1 Octopamine receptor 1 [Mizuhopecten yessoensis]
MENCSAGAEGVSFYDLSPGMIVACIALGLINLIVLLGNSLVITAVVRNRKLRTITNIYIVSLACADMLLAIFVLPFSAALEVLHFWPFGKPFCSMWLAIDVLLCTASILNLCAISLDRFLAVTKPIRYPSLVSKKRGKILVMCVWVLSFVISFPPLIGWNDENNGIQKHNNWLITEQERDNYTKGGNYSTTGNLYNERAINETICVKLYPECELTPTKGYRVYAALGSFYIPMFIMSFFYCRIYRAAIRTAASLRTGILMTKRTDEQTNNKCPKMDTIALRVHRGGGSIYRSPSNMSSRRTSYLICSKEERLANCNSDIELLPLRNRPISCNNNNKRSLTHNRSDSDLRNGTFRHQHRCTTDPASDSLAVYLGTSTSPRTQCPESPYQNRKLVVSNRNFGPSNRRHRSVLFINDGQPNQKINIRKFLRDTKAAKTVAIIVGAFLLCWFPFFTIYLIGAFCSDCVPGLAFSIFFWLGYCNSMINPFIYALFSRDFRCAFRRILSCRRVSRTFLFRRADQSPCNKRMLGGPVLESESYSDF